MGVSDDFKGRRDDILFGGIASCVGMKTLSRVTHKNYITVFKWE